MESATPSQLPVDLADVEAARDLLDGIVIRTPTVAAATLSERLGLDIRLKLENQQLTGSFKARGAYVRLSRLGEGERKRGVIAMSAGNHAQGVAYHAGRMGIPATIVMPETTPFSKVERTRALGAEVVLSGRSIADSAVEVRSIIERRDLVLVHPYDDPSVIAGQGTVALEMLADAPDLDTLIVPIGGGGLIAGVAVAAKALKPDIRVIGVEAAAYPSMREALAGLPATSGGDTIAEGIAVKTPGTLNQQIVGALVEDIVLVDEPDLEHAIHLLVECQKTVAEGAGAAGVAALLKDPERWRERRIGVVVCGGNIDARLLASVLMRGLVADGRIARIRIAINDEPGVLARIAGLVGRAGGNIVEVYHQRLFQDVPVKHADVDIVVETRNARHLDDIVSTLRGEGFGTRILSAMGRDGAVL